MMKSLRKAVSSNALNATMDRTSRNGSIGFDRNEGNGFVDNKICTSRYNFYNFAFLNLREQFRRKANIYFLLISILMLLGWYAPSLFQSSINPWGTFATLLVVLGITMIKDGLEDKARHKADRKENASPVRVLRNGTQQVVEKEEVRVGDYVLVENKEQFPADLILIASSDQKGQAFVETANIDGETNLKIRRVPHGIMELNRNAVERLIFEGGFECDAPNKDIHNFNAVVELDGKQVPCGVNNFLLRGSMLRNTNWIVGLVVYTGEETKIMMNRGDAPSKLSNIERTVNKLIVVVLLTQLIMVIVSVIINVGYVNTRNYPYLGGQHDFLLPYWLGNFFTFYILYSNFVPISLYVTMEMVNVLQAVFIEMDPDMYYAQDDIRAQCRNSTLCQELGQVEYIFSDKTGTLTCNIMEFKYCSVEGKTYDLETAINAIQRGNDENVFEFFKLLAVCHTVVPDHEAEQRLCGNYKCPVYEAESPDEGALVEAASAVGIRFWDRTPDSGTVKIDRTGRSGAEETLSFEILAVNEFNSTRKRMSILVREDRKRYVLYCKGADTVMFERTNGNYHENINEDLTKFAQDGLRTLVCAKRDVSESLANEWMAQYKQAQLNVDNRAQALDRVAEMMEQELQIIGASAIEDKLQDEVPETIEDLRKAGIKVWVLTGDKLETAVNIGYSCRLLDKSMRVVTIATETKYEAERELLRLENVISISENPSLLKRFKRRVGDMMKRVLPISSYNKKSSNSEEKGQQQEEEEQQDFSADASTIARTLVHEERVAQLNAQRNDANKHHRNKSSRIAKSASDDIELTSMESGQSGSTITTSGEDFRDDSGLNEITEEGEVEFMEGGEHVSTDHLALVIDGKTLTFIMSDPKLRRALLHVGRVCKAVIACRVSPAQKAEIVRLVKRGIPSKPITLAIGDGANDVTMIQKAHLGIGISGREGRQAVNSSDFAIGQFRFLKKLLLVHGRWNDRRMSKVILLCFYKNICLVFTLFIYSFWTLMSGTSLYDSWIYSGFNWFSGMPPLLLGVFDQDLSAEFLMAVPLMYKSGRESMYLNHREILLWMGRAGLHAIICALLPIYIGMALGLPNDLTSLYSFGTVMFTGVLLTTIVIIGTETRTWNAFHWFFFPGSILLYGIAVILFSIIPTYSSMFGVGQQVFNAAFFYALAVFLIPAINYGIELFCKYVTSETNPSIIQLGCEVDHGKSELSRDDFKSFLDATYYKEKRMSTKDIEAVMAHTYNRQDSTKTLSKMVARTASRVILYPSEQ